MTLKSEFTCDACGHVCKVDPGSTCFLTENGWRIMEIAYEGIGTERRTYHVCPDCSLIGVGFPVPGKGLKAAKPRTPVIARLSEGYVIPYKEADRWAQSR